MGSKLLEVLSRLVMSKKHGRKLIIIDGTDRYECTVEGVEPDPGATKDYLHLRLKITLDRV